MSFADDAVKNTKIQIRKAYTDVKKFHSKVDNKMMFILEKMQTNSNNTLGKE